MVLKVSKVPWANGWVLKLVFLGWGGTSHRRWGLVVCLKVIEVKSLKRITDPCLSFPFSFLTFRRAAVAINSAPKRLRAMVCPIPV